MGVSREDLHRPVDALPENELLGVLRFLEFVRSRTPDPFLLALAAAPIDDEPLTDEDLKDIEEADQDIARGDVAPLHEVERRVLKDAKYRALESSHYQVGRKGPDGDLQARQSGHNGRALPTDR